MSCRLLLLASLAGLAACRTVPLPERFVDAINDGEAVEGEIHGIYPELNEYVFTYRAPKDFFDFVEVSLVAPTPGLAAELAALRRHDRVRIAGRVLDNPSPQMHVELSSLEIVKRYEAEPAVPDYEYAASVPYALDLLDGALFLVHAVEAGGTILVVEYEDVVLPVFVQRPELTRDLARNDVVRLACEVRLSPDRPVHLQLKDVEHPIEVVESVMDLHGKPADVEGALVLFPKSPQVKFNVFAVLQELPGNLRRQYTLANFVDDAAFQAIRDKLQAAWDAAGPDAAQSGRNKLISTKLRVRATGTFNEVAAGQANVQILLDGPEDIEVLDS